jgi:non-specific protein-tyrosine kinase
LELVQYLRLARKWWWLIVLSAFVAVGVSFVVNVRQAPVYRTQTTISIGNYLDSPNPSSGEIRTGIDLAQTYARLATTFNVLQGTIDALGLPISADNLGERISTQILVGTSLLVITVTYNDPILAADIANTLAEQLIAKSPTNLTPEQQAQLDFLNTQITDLTSQIQQSREQLAEINLSLQSVTQAAELERLTNQRITTINQINEAQSTIAQYTNTVATLQQRTNALDIVEQARIPAAQSGSGMLTPVLLGLVIGVAISFGVVLVIEYLDDTIRNTEEAAQVLALPVMGAVVRFGKKAKRHSDMLVTNFPSMSPIAEGYRSARTNMLFSDRTHNGVFIITSPNPQEGKTITTSNIAVVMAQAGLNVLLIDADLRRPMVHNVFGLQNEVGLTTLLYSDPPDVNAQNGDMRGENVLSMSEFLRCVQNTDIPQLRVLTSGFMPSNPSEVLGSAAMKGWIDVFRAVPTIDIVIIDTPPTLAVADSQVLAAATEAEVLLVIDCGKTRRVAAIRAKDAFGNLGIKLKGVIANRVNPREEHYYGYYYGYYTKSGKPSQNGSHEPRIPVANESSKELR